MGVGFSPVGAATGGLAGPASILSHPSLNNFIGGGAYTQAVKKKSDGSDGSTTNNSTLLTQPSAPRAASATQTTGTNPISLSGQSQNDPFDTTKLLK